MTKGYFTGVLLPFLVLIGSSTTQFWEIMDMKPLQRGQVALHDIQRMLYVAELEFFNSFFVY